MLGFSGVGVSACSGVRVLGCHGVRGVRCWVVRVLGFRVWFRV